MQIKVNGKEVETSATKLSDLIEQLSLPQNGIAVAVDNKMIPRTTWNDFELKEGISLIIIKAACGG